jgi:hypothetical protein
MRVPRSVFLFLSESFEVWMHNSNSSYLRSSRFLSELLLATLYSLVPSKVVDKRRASTPAERDDLVLLSTVN